MKKTTVTKKEELFCKYLLSHSSPKEAAGFAGYLMPSVTAQKLLSQKRIQNYLKNHRTQNIPDVSEVADGLRRIAFGSISDAVKLVVSDDIKSADTESLDLMNVQELKIPKNGGIEIKFFDRIKALESLAALANNAESSTDNSFLDALTNSVKASEGDF